MHQTHPSARPAWKLRGLSLVLALSLLLGLVPGLDLGGSGSAHWAEPYLSQLLEWGFVRSDQTQNPDEELTRADFMAITNRAYGYSDQGPTPFEDIKETDWFYDDVEIAYTNKYIKGTSETTASPNDTLTRETAATILGRNMMLQESQGEILDFTDARDISFWSKGVIKSSLEHYLVSGYDDGTFRPQNSVTWGEMAAMVTRIVGTPLQEAGDYALGGVFGNVTITAPGVTLRDTVISGDLYITGGVGLGDIKLENVTVLGRIICSGTGEAEAGAASILLRNVTADELLIDNLQGKTVSVQADGITEIGKTTVRTSSYIEDNTPEGMGLKSISLEGRIDEEDEDADPVSLTLAGRIEDVVNKTPNSLVHVAKGTVNKLTIDEAATDSQVTIDRNAEVKELNLDTATYVTGDGDIKNLNINAPGCEVTILPEQITIRPGITAIINGEEMDTTAAEESNRSPMILSGYPVAEDVAPNSITAVFATNKKGTIYWAVSPITDGSVTAEDLIKPPVYGAISVARGSISSPQADEEVRAAITGLTPGGSYYLSAIMVDDRGQQSPVKVISFSTPDNSVPAFCQGYPYMSTTSARDGCQVVVMPTKSCNLYYALLPEGARAPTEDELKTNAVTGNLGYGVVPVIKNTESVIRVDDVTLEEQTNYVLYLWLVDADGANKSAITSLPFTTKDETPPYFIVSPTVNTVQATSVGLSFRLSEAGTVYWAVVPVGTEYPKKQPGHDTINLSDQWAKLQVQNGYSSLVNGQVAATVDRDGVITVSGLQPETSYELYYVAIDRAGNYSVMVQHLTINTLDENGPKIRQYFSDYDGTDETVNPMPDTDIILEFTENVRYNGTNGGEGFLELYTAYDEAQGSAAKNEALARLVTSVQGSITLWREDSGTGQTIQVTPRYSVLPNQSNHTENQDWGIDYEQVTITMRDGKMLVTFPKSALQLESGATYYFTIHDLTDTSTAQNPIAPSTVDYNEASVALGHNVPKFTTVFADVFLSDPGVRNGNPYERREAKTSGTPLKTDTLPNDKTTTAVSILDANHTDASEVTPATVDMHFQVTPRSTKTVEDNISYDIILWTDTTCTFDLYCRVLDGNGSPVVPPADNQIKTKFPEEDANHWTYLGYSGDLNTTGNQWVGKTINGNFTQLGNSEFPLLRNLSEDYRYEFAISLRSINGSDARATWSGQVNMKIQVAAGWSSRLYSLSQGLNWDTTWPQFQEQGVNGGAQSVGKDINGNFYFDTFQLFTDTRLPVFANNMPSFTTTSDSVTMNLALDRAGTIYYAIGKAEISPSNKRPAITTTYVDTSVTGDSDHDVLLNPAAGEPQVPRNGTENLSLANQNESVNADPYQISNPMNQYIFNPQGWVDALVAVDMDNIYNPGGASSTPVVDGLEADTTYFAYFVLKGTAQEISRVYVYQFTTEPIRPPKIQDLTPIADGNARTETDVASIMDYRVFNATDAANANYIPILHKPLVGNHNTAYTVPSPYNNYTILQALTTPYDVSRVANPSASNVPMKDGVPDTSMNDYTVFDIYASDDVKRDVYDMILNGRTSNQYTGDVDEIDDGHNINIAATTPTDLPLNGILPGGTYILLTMARNQQSDENGLVSEIYSFRAAERIGIIEQGAPQITQITAPYATQDKVASGDAQTYTGNFTILFDKNIYWRQDANSPYYPAAGSDAFDSNGNPTQKDIMSNAMYGPGTASASCSTVPTNAFRFNFENMPNNGSIVIQKANICNSSGQPVDDDLVITFHEEVTTSGTTTTTRFYATATWGNSSAEIDLYRSTATSSLNLVSYNGVTLSASGENYILNLTRTNNTSDIIASLNPENPGYNITWTSSDTDVATVSPASGNDRQATITAKGIGTATITVVAGGAVSKTITVNVNGTLSLGSTATTGWATDSAGGGALQITMGATPVTITTTPEFGNPKYIWESSNERVVTAVNGVITPVGVGAATVTVRCGPITRTITVTVQAARTQPDATNFNPVAKTNK